MAEPFTERSSASARILSLPGGGRKRATILDIENLLARADRVVDVGPEQIKEVAERHGVDLLESVHTPRLNLYRRLLEHCLADYALSSDESEDLAHLRTILELGDEEVRAIHDDVACMFYGRAMDQVLADYRLDPEEEQFLQRLRSELEMNDELSVQLQEAGSARAKQRFLSKSLVPGSAFVASREANLELVGKSEAGLEGAIRDAVEGAKLVGPQLAAAELTQVRVEFRDGGVGSWSGKLKATLSNG